MLTMIALASMIKTKINVKHELEWHFHHLLYIGIWLFCLDVVNDFDELSHTIKLLFCMLFTSDFYLHIDVLWKYNESCQRNN